LGGKAVEVGDVAPDFRLKSQNGQEVSLKEFLGKPVVLYFYPKDFTPGCTTEACAFRDSFEAFKDIGAEVIGVSTDTIESHEKFAREYNLPFRLLADEDGKVRNLYGVPKSVAGLIPGRVTYVIDRMGVVRDVFSSQSHVERHVEEALRILKLL
jgi:thioredoxin-dependent peroxiredoxin